MSTFFNCVCSRNKMLLINILRLNFLKPTGYMMHQQFNIQQLYALPTLHLCVLYLSENKLTCATYTIN
jgi:hypothetical protein